MGRVESLLGMGSALAVNGCVECVVRGCAVPSIYPYSALFIQETAMLSLLSLHLTPESCYTLVSP